MGILRRDIMIPKYNVLAFAEPERLSLQQNPIIERKQSRLHTLKPFSILGLMLLMVSAPLNGSNDRVSSLRQEVVSNSSDRISLRYDAQKPANPVFEIFTQPTHTTGSQKSLLVATK